MNRADGTSHRGQLLIKLVLTLMMVGVVAFIGRIGLADFLRLEATTYVDKFNEGRVRPSMERLAKARERLLLARRMDSGNPIIPEYLAQISYIRAAHSSIDKELQQGYLNDALREYQQALSLRPNSGYLWAGEMTVIHLLMTLDEPAENQLIMPTAGDPQWRQLVRAMGHSIQLSPWEPGVLRQVVAVGSRYYPALAVEERQLFDSAKRNAELLKLVVK